MISHTRVYEISAGHRVIGDDVCGRLHGHTFRFEITAQSESLAALRFALDTETSQLRRFLAHAWGGRLLLCGDDPMVAVLGNQWEIFVQLPCPPTLGNLAAHVGDLLAREIFGALPGPPVQCVRCVASYSHGHERTTAEWRG